MELINIKTSHFRDPKSLLFLLNHCTRLHHLSPMVLSYKECLKNHAASLGGHALDGCGEFMPSPSATPTDPASLKCAACGCHRNFHRRDPYDGPASIRGLPPPPNASSSPSHTPPSPVPHSYYTSAPHMLLALTTAYSSGPLDEYQHHPNSSHPWVPRINNNNNDNNNPSGRKRARTKFSKEQKEKMHAFAERLGWRMQKSEERSIQEFCYEVGVDRRVFKVWMHNNKNTFNKKDILAVANLNLTGNNNEEDGNEGSIQLQVSTNNGSPVS
ncbi:hypothetical protein V6N12_020515 [Hibiscus sabdariffa]|uniref:ZF-HD dimerization-type domain-containing protein n=1 Tax=Hibiscus sabdariffa TaxID=183260 RepID=A0ABR2D0Z7_9ROSI